MQRRDQVLAQLALSLRLIDQRGLQRAQRLVGAFPGRSFDRILMDGGLIDAQQHRALVAAFNERLRASKTGQRPPSHPATRRDPATRADPSRHAAQRPYAPAPATEPQLSRPPGWDADPLIIPPEDSEEGLGLPEDEILAQPTMVLQDEPGEDEILAQPTMVLQDEPSEDEILAQPTMVLQDETSAELEVPADIFAEPTMVIQEEPSEDEILAQPTMVIQEEPSEDEILAQPTMVLQDEPSEDEILAQPTMVLQDEDGPDIHAQGTVVLQDEGQPSNLEFDLRLKRDVSVAPSRSNRPMPGVRSRKGGGPLNREEFERRQKMRLGFQNFTIADYTIKGEISRGAFGVVLEVEAGGVTKSLAQDRGYSGRLALKVALENKSDPRETERFLDETRIQIGFNHPHIVRIFDSGAERGLTYYSMELLKGTEARTYVQRNGPLPPLLAVRYAKEVASALAYVHAQRIYHRDLKPQNVMLDQATQPFRAVLIDFGLVTEHEKNRDKGLILGTPSYMPPEQAQPRGGHGGINATSDIYSLGATLFYMLTGKAPFTGRDPRAIIRMVVNQKPPDPCELNPDLPRRIGDICLKCLEKRQRDRFHSAKQFAAELDRELRSGRMKIKAKSFLGKFLGKKK